MPVLTARQMEYGVFYFHKDEPQPKRVIEVAEYNGESALSIHCTQLGDSFTPQYAPPKEKKRVLSEWCEFLSTQTEAFTALTFNTRMPQELFNAVCKQKKLRRLYVKWGSYPDISAVSNLKSLEYLYLGSGSSVQSIEPLARLERLVALSLENLQNIYDYSPLAQLARLESLDIHGDGFAPKHIHPDSLDFLTKMPQLRAFSFITARLRSKDFTPVLSLQNLEHLSLPPSREVKAMYEQLAALPKLRYGLIATKPELYKK